MIGLIELTEEEKIQTEFSRLAKRWVRESDQKMQDTREAGCKDGRYQGGKAQIGELIVLGRK